MGVLSAVLLSANYALCVLDRDTSFRLVHKNDKADHSHKHKQHERYYDIQMLVLVSVDKHIDDSSRTSRNDTGEQYYRNTVADALFVDSVAEPYHKACSRRERKNYYRR